MTNDFVIGLLRILVFAWIFMLAKRSEIAICIEVPVQKSRGQVSFPIENLANFQHIKHHKVAHVVSVILTNQTVSQSVHIVVTP